MPGSGLRAGVGGRRHADAAACNWAKHSVYGALSFEPFSALVQEGASPHEHLIEVNPPLRHPGKAVNLLGSRAVRGAGPLVLDQTSW